MAEWILTLYISFSSPMDIPPSLIPAFLLKTQKINEGLTKLWSLTKGF